MSTTSNAAVRGLSSRDDRREAARTFGFEQKFCEDMVNVSYDRMANVLCVHPTRDGKAAGRLAVCGDLANVKSLLPAEERGVWHAPRGRIKGGPAVLALDFASVRDAYRVGCNATLLCVDPKDLPKMDGAEWTRFFDDRLRDDLKKYHSAASVMLIVHGPGTKVHPDALESIMVCARRFCSVPVMQLPDYHLIKPGSPKRRANDHMHWLMLRLVKHPCRAIVNSEAILPRSWHEQ